MIAEGIAKYEDAMALIETLKENGIDANITVGGIRVNPRLSDPEINQTRGNAPLNARLAVMLSALTPGVTLNESPSDAQILAAVQAVVGEVLDLREFRDNVRNLATDRPLALQCKQQFIEALSEDAPF